MNILQAVFTGFFLLKSVIATFLNLLFLLAIFVERKLPKIQVSISPTFYKLYLWALVYFSGPKIYFPKFW